MKERKRMKRDRFAGRYIIKIGSSVLLVLLNLIISFILPRAFSVEQYGFYTFNLSVFTNIVGIANLQSSNALSAKYSKRNGEVGIVMFYLKFFILMTAVLTIGLMILYPIEYIRNSLGGQTILVVVLGMETAILNKLLTDTITIYDSIAVTRFPALMQIVLKICMSVFVVITFYYGFLDIVVFYIGQLVVFIIIIAILLRSFFKDCYRANETTKDLGWREYLKEFYDFCRPLILVGVFAQALNIVMDVTLLDNQGPTVRAMYGVAVQLNALIVYVFNPYAELSKREYAIRAKDPGVLKVYVIQSAKTVMWLTSYFAVFIALMSDKIVLFIFGEGYSAAVPTVILMMGFTIYQAWGQVLGSYFIALEKTKVSAVFTVIAQIATLIATLIFIMPNSIWESGLGAEGMALTRLVANCIYVLIMASWIAKDIGYSIGRMNGIHVATIMILMIVMLISRGATEIIVRVIGTGVFLYILVCGVVYTVFVVFLLYTNPHLLGVTREQMNLTINGIKDKAFRNAKE